MAHCSTTIQSSRQPESASKLIGEGLRLVVKGCKTAALATVDAAFDAMEARRQRRQLLEADDRTLKDIGLSRADAYRLASGRKRAWSGANGQ